jgi:hypothetical protein
LRAALLLTAAFALLALARTALPWPALALTAVAVCGDTLLALRRHTGWWGKPAATALRWDGSGWLWIDAGGRHTALTLRHATLWRGLILLRFRCAATGKNRVLALLPDSAERDALRRLRVHLRHLPVFAQ